MRKVLAGVLGLALAVGVASPARADQSDIGLVLGALGGGVLGHQVGHKAGNTWATAIGAVAGGVVGQSMGRSMDRADYVYRDNYRAPRYSNYSYGQAQYYAAPTPIYYVSPSYERRVRTYEVRQAAYVQPVYVQQPAYVQQAAVVDNSMSGYCREYQSNVTVGNHTADSYGTACMQPDGSWKVMH